MRASPAITCVVLVASAAVAHAEDKVDFTTTWYQEQRQGGLGGLTVIHPQLDLGIDAGEKVSFEVGYSADAVTGATATVYSVDAVSTATTFDDLRHEGKVGLGFTGKQSSLGLLASIGVERDYLSLAVGGTGSVDLPGKNTNLALAYTHSFDEVCDRANTELTLLERRALEGTDPCKKNVVFGEDTFLMDNPLLGRVTTWRDLQIDTVQATLTQNLSPTMVMQVSLYGQVLEGFQSNPYRRVRIGPNEPQEHIPDTRARAALSARLNRFLPKLRSAVHVSTRAYADTWGVNSGTVELGYSQYMGDTLLLNVRARAYQQTPATFFKDAFFYETESTAGEYFTGDRELAPVRNALIGARLTMLSIAEDDKKVWGAFDRLQLNLKAEALLLDELAADDPEANTGGRDSQFLTSDQLLDAFTLQLGILLDY